MPEENPVDPMESTTGDVGLTSSVNTISAHRLLPASASAASLTVTLPPAEGSKFLSISVKKVDPTGNTVTIDGHGSQTIDGAETVGITSQYETITVTSDGSNWHIV